MNPEVVIKLVTTDRYLRHLLSLAHVACVEPTEVFAAAVLDEAKAFERRLGATPEDDEIIEETLRERLLGLAEVAKKFPEGDREAEFRIPRVVAIAAGAVARGAGITTSRFCAIVLSRLFGMHRIPKASRRSEEQFQAGIVERIEAARKRARRKVPAVASLARQARARLARAFASVPVKIGLERVETGRVLPSGAKETTLRPQVEERVDDRVFFRGSRLSRAWRGAAAHLRGWFGAALRAAQATLPARSKVLRGWDAAPSWARRTLSTLRGVRVDPALLLLSG